MNYAMQRFLEARRIAVVGVSRRAGFGNLAFKSLRAKGFEVVPVNSAASQVEGEPCYQRLADIPGGVDAVLCVVPPAQSARVVDECIALGISRVWLQSGAASSEAIARAGSAGLSLVHDACVLMYADPRGLHRLHRWLHHLGKPSSPATA
jgi:predicted CoA-binding protein